MKKLLLVSILFFFGVGAASAGETVTKMERQALDFAASETFMLSSYVCDSSDVNCILATTGVPNNPVLHVVFYAPTEQSYWRHYIVSDMAGTVVLYAPFNGVLTPGAYIFNLAISLPPGEYFFAFVGAGTVGGMAISHEYAFGVR